MFDVGISVERRSAVAGPRIDRCAAHTTASPNKYEREETRETNTVKTESQRGRQQEILHFYASLLLMVKSLEAVKSFGASV